jgi:hypothetical protein
MYQCQHCHTRRPEPRWFALYLGDYPRCPRCGTYRLTRLSEPDHIDRMYRSALSLLQWVLRADLYHCRYCRIQFYDVRGPVAAEAPMKQAAAAAVGGAGKPA